MATDLLRCLRICIYGSHAIRYSGTQYVVQSTPCESGSRSDGKAILRLLRQPKVHRRNIDNNHVILCRVT
jgi:hypothetical protein